jgi:hypothetical protein
MSEALVERMITGMCRFIVDVYDLSDILTSNLDDNVITHGQRHEGTEQTYGSEAQIGLMRRMNSALQEDAWDRERILEIDHELESAARGPLFYNLIVILYKEWSRRWIAEHEWSDSDVDADSGDDEVVQNGLPHAHAFAMSAGADMRALLNKLHQCV